MQVTIKVCPRSKRVSGYATKTMEHLINVRSLLSVPLFFSGVFVFGMEIRNNAYRIVVNLAHKSVPHLNAALFKKPPREAGRLRFLRPTEIVVGSYVTFNCFFKFRVNIYFGNGEFTPLA